MHILDKILRHKQAEVVEAALSRPLAEIVEGALEVNRPAFSFSETLSCSSFPAVIAEFKRASPSKGEIAPGKDPILIAKSYIKNGASALSVLTDEEFFQGSMSDLMAARKALPDIPILRKDFTVDPYQVWEAKLAGADAALLIARIVDQPLMLEILEASVKAEIDLLFEIHEEGELELLFSFLKAHGSYPELAHRRPLVGINNRDLDTFKVSLETSKHLIRLISREINALSLNTKPLFVSESGISDPSHLLELKAGGAEAFLIGESLMKTSNPGLSLSSLIDGTK